MLMIAGFLVIVAFLSLPNLDNVGKKPGADKEDE